MMMLTRILCMVWAALSLMGVYAQSAHAEQMPVMGGCVLSRYGDCCTITVKAGQPVNVTTPIANELMVDFVALVNNEKTECTFGYDGDMKTMVRMAPEDTISPWLGGTFTLTYKSDEKKTGACTLDVFYMNIGSRYMGKSLPQCVKNRFD